MNKIPASFAAYRKTPTFTPETVPKGLLREHRTKAGVWGKIVVLKGSLRYRILRDPVEEHVLRPDRHGVVEPEVPHEVAFLDDGEFYVEFYAQR
jgi:tellurite resistance-related uncharacterized protein